MAKIHTCRLCGGKLKQVISLGSQPLVNHFPTQKETLNEKKYPLNFCVCQKCGFCQIDYIISPKKIFRNYDYVSNASSPLVEHLKSLALSCAKDFGIKKDSKVLDIGANDGTLLSFFKNAKTLGVEPAINIAKNPKTKIVQAFFSLNLAKTLSQKYGQFDLIFATHTLANIVDLHNFIKGLKLVLSPNGTLVIEVGSLKEMLTRGQFDAIYHEHYSYFSFQTLRKLLSDHDFTIFKAEKNNFHGGSLRIFANHSFAHSKPALIKEQITNKDFQQFVKTTRNFKLEITKLLKTLKGSLAGLGAPGKSVTLLNYCKLDKSKIDFITDTTPVKQGKFMPGTGIPIYSEDYLKTNQPNYLLLLAWNYKEEMLKKLARKKIRSQIIIPFPKLKTVRL